MTQKKFLKFYEKIRIVNELESHLRKMHTWFSFFIELVCANIFICEKANQKREGGVYLNTK